MRDDNIVKDICQENLLKNSLIRISAPYYKCTPQSSLEDERHKI